MKHERMKLFFSLQKKIYFKADGGAAAWVPPPPIRHWFIVLLLSKWGIPVVGGCMLIFN